MNTRKTITGIFAALFMAILILDAKTVLSGATDGLKLCISTVIPALFPFFVLCPILNNAFWGCRVGFLQPVCRLCGIPQGGESLLLVGFLGGYPIGASSINDAYRNGSLTREVATRMMGFCCNAGPAFIFGMLGSLFKVGSVAWYLWGIHILSALAVGMILPGKKTSDCRLPVLAPIQLSQAVKNAIINIAGVCGWVIIFRVIIAVCQRWFLWLFPKEVQTVLIAALELTNGCWELHGMSNSGLRFILSSAFLGFGGMCVTMQTVSVSADLGLGMYLPGKILQMLLSILAAGLVQSLIFDPQQRYPLQPVTHLLLILGVILIILYLYKKEVAFPVKMLYNAGK